MDCSRIIIKCPDRLNSQGYQTILFEELTRIFILTTFMQDGTPCHKSKSTMNFLDGLNICVLSDCPAQSPDLNIIENLWSMWKKNVRKLTISNVDELWQIVQD